MNYIKPIIEDEIIELEDVIASSNGGDGKADDAKQGISAGNIFGNN